MPAQFIGRTQELELLARLLDESLSADQKKTYCLYEATDREALLKHAASLGSPPT